MCDVLLCLCAVLLYCVCVELLGVFWFDVCCCVLFTRVDVLVFLVCGSLVL